MIQAKKNILILINKSLARYTVKLKTEQTACTLLNSIDYIEMDFVLKNDLLVTQMFEWIVVIHTKLLYIDLNKIYHQSNKVNIKPTFRTSIYGLVICELNTIGKA